MLDTDHSMQNEINLEVFLHTFRDDGVQASETKIFDIMPFLNQQQCEETLKDGSKFQNLYICEVDTREYEDYLAENPKNRVDLRVKFEHTNMFWKSGYTIDGVLLFPISDK